MTLIYLSNAVIRRGRHFGETNRTREHKNLDKLKELLLPLNLGKVYTDGNYAYYEKIDAEVLVVSKKNT